MGNTLETKVKLINDQIKFEATAGNNLPIITDYIPPFGNLEGYMPLEVFLISLSACLGGSIAILVRKMGFIVDALSVNATGQRREVHPTYFDKITIKINLKSPNAAEADLHKALKLSEEQFCPVIAMINDKVAITYDCILEA
jgi:putative redox protein